MCYSLKRKEKQRVVSFEVRKGSLDLCGKGLPNGTTVFDVYIIKGTKVLQVRERSKDGRCVVPAVSSERRVVVSGHSVGHTGTF